MKVIRTQLVSTTVEIKGNRVIWISLNTRTVRFFNEESGRVDQITLSREEWNNFICFEFSVYHPGIVEEMYPGFNERKRQFDKFIKKLFQIR